MKGCLQAKVAVSGEKKKRCPCWLLMEPLILRQWKTHPVGDCLTARGQVFARYLSHFSDLKAFNQLCQGACQSCQTMSRLQACSIDTVREGNVRVRTPNNTPERKKTKKTLHLLYTAISSRFPLDRSRCL